MDVRADFPILQRKINGRPLVYLDNAATTQKPVQVLDAVSDFYKNNHANLGRGVHTLALETTEIYEGVRKKVARFINAKPGEIILTNNTTQSLNMIAHNYSDLKETDNIVTTIMEHHSNFVPWKIISEKTGCGFEIVDITDSGELDMSDYESKIDSNTKVVAATHISNVLGTINPTKEIARIAHENNSVFILDAAQSAAHRKIDVKKLDCDFMAFSGHKMLSPMGIGVMYGKSDLLEDMTPSLYGGGMVETADPGKVTLLDSPRKFEAGTQNVGGAVGVGAAIDYLEKYGMGKIQKHEEKLTEYALKNLGGVDIYGPKERAGVISFNVPGIDSSDVATIADEQGIALRSGQHCAQPLMNRLGINSCTRMSFYIYNTLNEVKYTLEVIDKIKELA